MSERRAPAPAPIDVKRRGREGIDVVWDDGHRSNFHNRYLRDNCPCAVCRERPATRRVLPVVGGQEVYALEIHLVGRYALNIHWSDGHDSGIYSYETLRALCPCDNCQQAVTASA